MTASTSTSGLTQLPAMTQPTLQLSGNIMSHTTLLFTSRALSLSLSTTQPTLQLSGNASARLIRSVAVALYDLHPERARARALSRSYAFYSCSYTPIQFMLTTTAVVCLLMTSYIYNDASIHQRCGDYKVYYNVDKEPPAGIKSGVRKALAISICTDVLERAS